LGFINKLVIQIDQTSLIRIDQALEPFHTSDFIAFPMFELKLAIRNLLGSIIIVVVVGMDHNIRHAFMVTDIASAY
jgi:hypothetical protein